MCINTLPFPHYTDLILEKSLWATQVLAHLYLISATSADIARHLTFFSCFYFNLSSVAKRIFEAISNEREKTTYIRGTASHIWTASCNVEDTAFTAHIPLWPSEIDLIYDLQISHATLHTFLNTLVRHAVEDIYLTWEKRLKTVQPRVSQATNKRGEKKAHLFSMDHH